MSEYTPGTWAILNGYMYCRGQNPAQSADEFHRWLAEVKAQAWQEGVETAAMAETGFSDPEVAGWTGLTNPYKEEE